MNSARPALHETMSKSVQLSLLDRSRTRKGEEDALALHRTIARAQRAEADGYHRFWVAEHHGVPGVASGSPAVLLAAVGAATASIRIGSGGVMLPNHPPFVVAEQFLMLEALYPGRVDLGVGRSLGFTAGVRRALRTEAAAAERFPYDLAELRDALAGTGPITARPAASAPPPVFVLAMQQGLEVAGQAGLPTVVGGSLLRNPDALAQYRERAGDAAHLIVSVDIMIAKTRERARQLLLPEAWAMVRSRETGEFGPLESVDSVLAKRPTARQQEGIDDWLANAIYGDSATVGACMDELIAFTGADEIMSSASTFADADRDDADAALAAIMATRRTHA
ncbi:MsnO8 family LLM class oxidoreductase [Specibacter sp. AOP5-B1-6]|uniref:MsnO8 family LLM class oxidoreductase n=1 Tax=Specibacter sp. AOP5-B1-6 TaxID=3457653 RepID=UPI00402BDFAD